MENYIQLKKNNILKIGIRDEHGNPTGECLTFDFEGTTALSKLSRCETMHKQNQKNLQNKLYIIDKKEDKKGEGLLSWKEEQKLKAYEEFYNDEIKALDLFVGEGGTRKLLNGREPYYTMYEDIGDILEPIMPLLKINLEEINKKIISKYSDNSGENNDLQ